MVLMAVEIQSGFAESGAGRDNGGIAAGLRDARLQRQQVSVLQRAQSPRRGLHVIQQRHPVKIKLCRNFCSVELPGQVGNAGRLTVHRASDTQAGGLQRLLMCLGKHCQDVVQGRILLTRVTGFYQGVRLLVADIKHRQPGVGAADIAGKYAMRLSGHLEAGLDRCIFETLDARQDFLASGVAIFPAINPDPLVGFEVLVVIEEVRNLVE